MDQELLQAISGMIDEKLAAQTQEVRRYMEETREDTLRETRLMMENYFEPKFNLLAENQQIMMERFAKPEDLEVLDTRVSALEAMVKKINRELKELKKAQ